MECGSSQLDLEPQQAAKLSFSPLIWSQPGLVAKLGPSLDLENVAEQLWKWKGEQLRLAVTPFEPELGPDQRVWEQRIGTLSRSEDDFMEFSDAWYSHMFEQWLKTRK